MSKEKPLLTFERDEQLAERIFGRRLAEWDESSRRMDASAAPARGSCAGPGRGMGTRSPWVLVVDDAPLTRAFIGDYLALNGYRVQLAANGALALPLLDPEPPGLVVLDMLMPAMNGREFARIMRERGLAIPILVIAAAPEAARWAAEIGANGWLGKPFRLAELRAAVARQLPPPGESAG